MDTLLCRGLYHAPVFVRACVFAFLFEMIRIIHGGETKLYLSLSSRVCVRGDCYIVLNKSKTLSKQLSSEY